jgi:hypothetical protein
MTHSSNVSLSLSDAWLCEGVTCTKHYLYVKVRINFSISEYFYLIFWNWAWPTLRCWSVHLTRALCLLFHVEATPPAYVNTPFATFCTSWFLGMWPLFPLQWAVEGTRKETDRVGRSAWKVVCVGAAHTATDFKLKDVSPICGLSTRTLVSD